MPETLNISLAPGQLAWLKARKEQEGFATASDVVRDLIRRQQEMERAALEVDGRLQDGIFSLGRRHGFRELRRSVAIFFAAAKTLNMWYWSPANCR